MKERGNDSRSGRILVLCCSRIAEDVRMLFLLDELKNKYSLRVCMIPDMTDTSDMMFAQDGWSTNLPERVLDGINLVILVGMSKKLADSLKNGLLEQPEVKLLTLCFAKRMQVYLYDQNPWQETAILPEPVQKFQENKKKICDLYGIRMLKKQQLERITDVLEGTVNKEERHVYTMEDVVDWDRKVIIQKGAYFTPLAADYVREKKICVEYK